LKRECLRLSRLLLGLFLYGVGIVLTVHARLGVAPWDVFHQGVSLRLGVTFGQASILVSLALILLAVLVRERFGFGTLCNMILIGVFVDLLMLNHLIPTAATFFSGLVMMATGLFVIALATYCYMGAGYGAGPRDSLMVVMTRKTGRPVGFCRTLIEGAALLIGWYLGGHAGLGTVIAVFGSGFAVQAVFTALRFDPRTIHQESLAETLGRFFSFIRKR